MPSVFRCPCFRTVAASAACLVASAGLAHAQDISFRFEATTIPFIPLHSHVHAEISGDSLFFGGITGQGLHNISQGNGVNIAFPLNVFNDEIVLYRADTNQVLTASTSHLSQPLREALLFTTPGFIQLDDTLHIYGGYGPLENGTEWTTKASVTSIDLAAVRQAIINGQPVPESAFTLTPSAEAEVAGTGIVRMGDKFALIGGSNFVGDYGLGWNQQTPFQNTYSTEVHIFDPAVSIAEPVQTFFDYEKFFRRDLNFLPIQMPDGEGGHKPGFIAASGVFKYQFAAWEEPLYYGVDENEVLCDLSTEGFKQRFNTYEAPNISLWSESDGENRVIILGGLSLWIEIEPGFVIDDPGIWWVTQISEFKVANGDGVHDSERIIGHTPVPTTNTHLMLAHNLPKNENGQVMLDQMPHNEVLVGKIFGGLSAIEVGAAPDTFASSTVYNVYMTVGLRGDVTQDGSVGFSDLNVILNQFGQSGEFLAGDLNLDGSVGFSDLNVVLNNFGSSAAR